tara:strand:- start:77 stop:661 length:585 start_codon:yes stop_codon:yes gene_type:complete
MVKLIGVKKINAAVFISGTGSNLRSLLIFFKNKNFNIKIKLILSNNPKAKGLKYAKIFKIKKKIIVYKNQNLAEKKILSCLKKNKINLVCLAGFMRLLSRRFINSFNGKIINIHPSLLPKYKGLNTHRRVINKKERYSGCTVHYVNHKVDSGKIIMQKKVKINKKDTVKTLSKKILKQEHRLYPKALLKIYPNL